MRGLAAIAGLAAACGGGGGGGAPVDAGCLDLACPVPASSADISVCGYVDDIGTGATITDRDLSITFYDALAYESDPAGTPPLPVESPTIDDCGVWIGDGVRWPASDRLLVAVDGPGRRTTMIDVSLVPGTGGTVFPDVPARSLRTFTDQVWSQELGMIGATLVDQGAVLTNVGGPGKVVTIGGGSGNVYYFADTGLGSLAALDPAAGSTSSNGGVLLSPVDGVVSVSGSPYPGVQMTSVPGTLLLR